MSYKPLNANTGVNTAPMASSSDRPTQAVEDSFCADEHKPLGKYNRPRGRPFGAKNNPLRGTQCGPRRQYRKRRHNAALLADIGDLMPLSSLETRTATGSRAPADVVDTLKRKSSWGSPSSDASEGEDVVNEDVVNGLSGMVVDDHIKTATDKSRIPNSYDALSDVEDSLSGESDEPHDAAEVTTDVNDKALDAADALTKLAGCSNFAEGNSSAFLATGYKHNVYTDADTQTLHVQHSTSQAEMNRKEAKTFGTEAHASSNCPTFNGTMKEADKAITTESSTVTPTDNSNQHRPARQIKIEQPTSLQTKTEQLPSPQAKLKPTDTTTTNPNTASSTAPGAPAITPPVAAATHQLTSHPGARVPPTQAPRTQYTNRELTAPTNARRPSPNQRPSPTQPSRLTRTHPLTRTQPPTHLTHLTHHRHRLEALFHNHDAAMLPLRRRALGRFRFYSQGTFGGPGANIPNAQWAAYTRLMRVLSRGEVRRAGIVRALGALGRVGGSREGVVRANHGGAGAGAGAAVAGAA